MRRHFGFGGSSAAFDSHSMLMLMLNDEHFKPTSERWKRGHLKGKVVIEDIEDLHESMHWLQFISTSTGELINLVRLYRDETILGALKEESGLDWEQIEDRLQSSTAKSIFDVEKELKETISKNSDFRAVEIAALQVFFEKAFLYRDALADRYKYLYQIAKAIYLLINKEQAIDSKELESFVMSYLRNSEKLRPPSTDRGCFSTSDMLETHAMLTEQFFLKNYDNNELANERFLKLESSDYNDPYIFAIKILFRGLSDVEYFSIVKNKGPGSIWLTIVICIDLALDIYIPDKKSDLKGTSEIDIFPPVRYERVLEAACKIGLFDFKMLDDLNGYRSVLEYRENVRKISDVRIGSTKPFYNIGNDERFKLILNTRSENDTYSFGNSNLYEFVNSLQSYFHRNKKKYNKFYLFDPIFNLSNNNSPTFSNFYHDTSDYYLMLGRPLVTIYDNGGVGLADNLKNLATELLKTSIVSYARYSLAFESGSIYITPKSLSPAITINKQTPMELFVLNLKKDFHAR